MLDDTERQGGHEDARRDRHRQRGGARPARSSPRTRTSTSSLYPNELTRQIAEVAYDSTAFLFDGSDPMPGEVGAGSFWKEMTAWITGQQDLDTALKNIDDSWPSS